MQFKFTNKEEYLAYRSNWKAQYKSLSQDIRNAKFCQWYCSLGEKRTTPQLTARYEEIKGYTHWSIPTLKFQARNMLEELKLAKVEAQRQYLASKQAVAA